MKMEELTPSSLLTTALVVLLLMAAFVAVMQFVEAVKKAKRPSNDLKEKVEQHDAFFTSDRCRLDSHDRELADVREGQKAMCKGVQALLEHELHNGNSDQMMKASEGINAWLLDGKN